MCSVVSCLQYFPGRPVVMNLLRSVDSWLQNQSGGEITYEALRKILDNSAQVSKDRGVYCRRTPISFDLVHQYRDELGTFCSFLSVKPTPKLFLVNLFLSVFHLWYSSDSEVVCPLHTALRKYMNANWDKEQTFVSLSREASKRKGNERRGDQNRRHGITKCTRLMWGRLSGSSLVVPLRYQGHLSVLLL